MASAKLFKADGSGGAPVQLNDEVFGIESNKPLVHQVTVALMNAKRQGNAETKTRKEVRGGGAKPFRQKGTGRARQGSSREPHMRGGGTVFGPHRRSYRQEVPLKMRRKALRCVLSERVRAESLKVLEELPPDTTKTRPMANMFDALVPDGRKALLVTPGTNREVTASCQNLPRMTVRTASDVNALDILNARTVIVLQDAIGALEERLK